MVIKMVSLKELEEKDKLKILIEYLRALIIKMGGHPVLLEEYENLQMARTRYLSVPTSCLIDGEILDELEKEKKEVLFPISLDEAIENRLFGTTPKSIKRIRRELNQYTNRNKELLDEELEAYDKLKNDDNFSIPVKIDMRLKLIHNLYTSRLETKPEFDQVLLQIKEDLDSVIARTREKMKGEINEA